MSSWRDPSGHSTARIVFFRRIEIAFPVLDRKLSQRVIKEGLNVYLADNMQAWEMGPEGTYTRREQGKREAHVAQHELLELLAAATKTD